MENAAPLGEKCSFYAVSNNITWIGKVDNSTCPTNWFDSSKTIPCDEYVYSEKDTFVEEVNFSAEVESIFTLLKSIIFLISRLTLLVKNGKELS